MINETMQLLQALNHYGISLVPAHKDLKTSTLTPEKPCLLVLLDPSGAPAHAELYPTEEPMHCWRHARGGHNNLPKLTIHAPLLAESESRRIPEGLWAHADIKQKREWLLALDICNANAASNDIIVTPWTIEKLDLVQRSDDPHLEALKRLLRRFPNRSTQDAFYANLRSFLQHSMRKRF